jgi:hypothetical protein
MERDEQGQGTHERARRLIAASHVEGISAGDRQWLDGHLAACAPCSQEASAVAEAIRSLRAAPVVASGPTVWRTRLAVRRRAEELRSQRERSVPLWSAVAVAAVWTLVTTPFTWWTFAALGRVARVPEPVWQVGFLLWWFLPATVLAAIVAWRHTGGGLSSSHWNGRTNWGQL